ncbi:unnamed protein product [Taenia asiatica]|uniref:Uncharacterized protein n=1 Tax=Taenia asiatica TaxID=60517 RepID=A0A0R3W6Z6_TAEAS|nr:unnamed protein product [Taenia asiatica]
MSGTGCSFIRRHKSRWADNLLEESVKVATKRPFLTVPTRDYQFGLVMCIPLSNRRGALEDEGCCAEVHALPREKQVNEQKGSLTAAPVATERR